MNNFIPPSITDPCRMLGGKRKSKKDKPLHWSLQLGSRELQQQEARLGFPHRHKHKLLAHRTITSPTSIACPRRWQEYVTGRGGGVRYLFPVESVKPTPRLVYEYQVNGKPYISFTSSREANDMQLAARTYGGLNKVKVVAIDRTKQER